MHFYLFCLSLSFYFSSDHKERRWGTRKFSTSYCYAQQCIYQLLHKVLCLYPPGPSMPPPFAWTVCSSVWLFRAAPSVGREGPVSRSQWSPCGVGLSLLPWDPWRVSNLRGDAGSAAGHGGAAEFLLSVFLFGEVFTVFTSSSLSPLHLGDWFCELSIPSWVNICIL